MKCCNLPFAFSGKCNAKSFYRINPSDYSLVCADSVVNSSGPVHTYRDISENGYSFSLHETNLRPHIAFSNRICPSTSTYTLASEVIVFDNLLFGERKRRIRSGREAKTEGKVSIFENIRKRADGVWIYHLTEDFRNKYFDVFFFFSILRLKADPLGLQKAAEFCPHHVGHYLGMDTHDTHMVSRGLGLHPGMVITVEPGIYISEDNQKVPERFVTVRV